MIEYLLALLAGVLTIASPCVLPMLPIVLGASVGRRNRLRPLLITLGFVITFAGFGMLFGLVTHVVGLSQNDLHNFAIALLAVFGLLMLWSTPLEWLNVKLSALVSRSGVGGAESHESLPGAFIVGATLGVIWTPCAGPVLGSILALVGSADTVAKGGLLLALYALGAGVPMLAIAYGGQYMTLRVRGLNRYTRRLQQGFGVVLVLLAAALYFQYDTLIEAWLADYYPSLATGL